MVTKSEVIAWTISGVVAIGSTLGWKYERYREDSQAALAQEARLVRVEEGVNHLRDAVDRIEDKLDEE